MATSLGNLAELYYYQGKYAEAEPLYKRALAIKEKALGPDHPSVATGLNTLALLYYNQGKYAEAEPLYKRALATREKALGPDHPDVAQILNNLALLYYNQGEFAQAEPLYKRVLAINEKALGPDHPQVALGLNNLALLYDDQGKYAEAEPLYKRSLAIDEKALGPDHPSVATGLYNLGQLYYTQGKYALAEPLFKRALAIYEKALGPEDVSTLYIAIELAGLKLAMKQHPQRTWTDNTGKHQRQAAFIGFEDGKVKLKQEDGKTSAIPPKRLSQEDKNYTLLSLCGYPEATDKDIQLLIQSGADINARAELGQTPLTLAARSTKDPKVVLQLLSAGANVVALDKAENIALGYMQINQQLNDTPAFQQLEADTNKALEAAEAE